jgi:hypothetical protein
VSLTRYAAGLDWHAEKAVGEYKAYFSDRVRQCHSWAAGVRDGQRNDIEEISAGLIEFEAIAL